MPGDVHESPKTGFEAAHSMMTSEWTRAASAPLSTLTCVVTTTDPALTLTVTDEAGTPSAAETLAMYSSEGKPSTEVWYVAFQETVYSHLSPGESGAGGGGAGGRQTCGIGERK